MKRLLRRIAPLLTLALLPSFAQAQEWSSIYERATSAQIDSTAKLLAQFGTDPTLQRWASLSQLIDESSIVQFELEDLFPDPGVLYRGSDQDFAQASTLSELSTVLGSTILSVSAIDTQAEFESLLFALPAGGGATVDSASFDNVFDTNGVLQRTADSTYASITDLAGLNTALGSSIADGAHFGGAFSDLSGTATAGQIPNLATSKITSGTFADARISASSVTQHEAALTVTESQISDLAHTTDTDDQAATEVLYAAGGTVADTTAALRTDVNAIDAAALGLGNVDNTADADKPVSTATQTALDAKQDTADLEDDVEQTVEVHELQDYATRVVDKTLYNRVDAGIAFQRTTVSGVTSYEWDPRDEPVLYVNLPGSTFTLNVDDTFEASGFAAELDVRVYFAQPAGGSIEVSWESPDFGFEGEMQILAAGDDDQPDPGASVVTRFDGTFTATTATIMRKSVRQTQ